MIDHITNDTGFAVYANRVLAREGERLLTVVKGTFVLQTDATALRPAPAAWCRPIRGAEVCWGAPLDTAPQYPCDLAPTKRATDVVVVAKGHAPGSKPTGHFDVTVRVGALSKTLRLFGVRAWQAGGSGLSRPRPVLEQEIRYDHAWGGLDPGNPAHPSGEMRNPVGRGWVRDAELLTDALAPCIEDPTELISSAATRPAPAGFGPLGPHWLPRGRFTGTYDEAWLADRAPLPPADLDDRHYQCASPGLLADPPLAGGEPVGLLNLTPGGGEVMFELPRVELLVQHQADDGAVPELHRPPIDTVVIDTLHLPPSARVLVELVWRTLTAWPEQPGEAALTVALGRRAAMAAPAPSTTPADPPGAPG